MSNEEIADLVENIERRLTKVEGRLESNQNLIRLSEEIVKLKSDETKANNKIHYESYNDLKLKITAILDRLTKVESRVTNIADTVDTELDKWNKSADLFFKRSEANEVISKKFSIVESLIENSEKKLISMIEKNTENTIKEVNRKHEESTKVIDELKDKKSDKTDDLKEVITKVESDNILMMKMINEMNVKTQSIQWMHDELTSIKRRQIQILSLLNEQSSEENDFLKNISEPTAK